VPRYRREVSVTGLAPLPRDVLNKHYEKIMNPSVSIEEKNSVTISTTRILLEIANARILINPDLNVKLHKFIKRSYEKSNISKVLGALPPITGDPWVFFSSLIRENINMLRDSGIIDPNLLIYKHELETTINLLTSQILLPALIAFFRDMGDI